MELECKRCGATWMQRGQNKPKTCSKCNSPYWEKPINNYWKSVRAKNNKFTEYESRKAALWNTCKSHSEYESKIKEICKELGI